MGYHLVTNGQQELAQNDATSLTVEIGLYDDSTDSIPVGGTLADITTEPGNVSRISSGITLSTPDDYVELNASATPITFDVSGSSETVDSYFVVVNSELFYTGALEQSRDLSGVDELELQTVGKEFAAPA